MKIPLLFVLMLANIKQKYLKKEKMKDLKAMGMIGSL